MNILSRLQAPAMDAVGVPLARVNADREKDFADEHSVTTLPVVRVLYQCKVPPTTRNSSNLVF